MHKQTSIYIPKPCHEDWNKMTPTQQGKFCSSCNKQVVDFSLMSDNQILNFLSNQSGKLCGRFDAEQLQRPLIETKIKKKKSWWMALTMPLLFLFDRSEAQKIIAMAQADTAVAPTFKQPEVMGKLAYQPMKQITIKGKVVDEKNEPLAYVTIYQKGTKNGTSTDSTGNFSINIKSYEDSITLETSCVGFISIEKRVGLSDANIDNVIVSLKEQRMGLSEVVVVGQAYTGRLGGAVAICTRISTREKLDTAFKKLVGISNAYPNPAIRGSNIHLQIKQAGTYQMQLLDDQSRLIMIEEINTDSDKSTTQIQLPSNIAAGMYYLRLIDEQKKKSYTEKLIIQ